METLEQQINKIWNNNYFSEYAVMEFKKQFPKYLDWTKEIWLDNIE